MSATDPLELPTSLLRTSAISSGTAFLYVFPCAWEDFLKLGFSRDPLARIQSLHRRYFEFFDLQRAFAIRVDHVRDARALETRWRLILKEHNAPAPLSINVAAGGAREWYRGAYDTLAAISGELAEAGFAIISPLRDWIANRLHAQAHLLYAFGSGLSEIELSMRGGASRSTLRQRQLGDLLDAYAEMGIELDALVPPRVLQWHRSFRQSFD